jgi:hypothetical protein
MQPFQGLTSELGVAIECSGPVLNFCPYCTIHLYLLPFRTSYLLSNTSLPEGRAGTAWVLQWLPDLTSWRHNPQVHRRIYTGPYPEPAGFTLHPPLQAFSLRFNEV